MSAVHAVDRRAAHGRRWVVLAVLLLISVWGASSILQAQAGIYRWRDAKGVVHYDQSLPEAAVSRGYEVLGSNGEVTRRVPPPLTPAEQAAAKLKAEAAGREEAREEARERHDRMLLQTFDSVGDIKHMLDERLRALGVQIQLAHDRVRQLGQGAAVSERAAAQAALEDLLRRRSDIRQEFRADIERFRQLKKDGASGP